MYADQDGKLQIRTGPSGELVGAQTMHAATAMHWGRYAMLCDEDPEAQARAEGLAWGYLYASLLLSYDQGASRTRVSP